MKQQASEIVAIWVAALVIVVLASLSTSATAAPASSLSRWLSGDTREELRQLLGEHPRYEGQRLRIIPASNDALSEAVATVLAGSLADLESISIVQSGPDAKIETTVSASIDEIDCQAQPQFDYLLRVEARKLDRHQDELKLELLDIGAPEIQPISWRWRGKFSSSERRYLGKPARNPATAGSLAQPWTVSAVQPAALALSRELACGLRPQLETRLSLYWPGQHNLPAVFADTTNASRHLLGRYREIGFTDSGADYRMEVRVEQFMGDTWQLWLTGSPRDTSLAPVQAVTYFKVEDLRWPVHARAPSIAPASQLKPRARPRPAPPANLGEPLDFLQVELLDATQTDKAGSRADLQVTVRIANTAQWPIEYGFSLSGGHFNDCIARPQYYRHDRYGKLAGSVDAGESVVRHLIIENAKHRPTPWLGRRQCAGFRDLEGFEEFASQGYRVTDFVRWDY